MQNENKLVRIFNELAVVVMMGLPIVGWVGACSHNADEPKNEKPSQEKVMKTMEQKAETAQSPEEAAKYWEKYMEAKEEVYCSGLSK